MALPRNPRVVVKEEKTPAQRVFQFGCILNMFMILIATLAALVAGTVWIVNTVISIF